MIRLLLAVALILAAQVPDAKPVRVLIETEAGEIEAEIDTVHAPITAANFLSFAAFGRVVRGMDVVRKIQMSPANGETLTPPVAILKVKRL